MAATPPERSAAAEAWIEVLVPDRPSRRVALHGDIYRLGRDPSVEIRLDHGAVSRVHALLRRRGSHWLLEDRDSTNGLWWHGRRVRVLDLADSDLVSLAPGEPDTTPALRFHRSTRPASAAWRGASLAATSLSLLGLAALALAAVTVPVGRSLAGLRGPLVLFDRTDKPLESVDTAGRRTFRALAEVDRELVAAILASEDDRFWWHPGLDPVGTLRALLTNLAGGRVLEGGSTVTQQLARSLYPEQVGRGDTLERKWRELLVALQLEARFSKEELLLAYINRVYLGVGWGFEEAARRYFGRSAAELEVDEAALLVGLLPSPNGHDPCRHPQRALEARNQVLAKMADSGRLGREQARAARRRPVDLAPEACSSATGPITAPYYTDQVRRDLESLVGPSVAREGNFLIETHLDPVIQTVVQQQLERLLAGSAGLGVSEGAVVVMDYRSGGILALSGGRDYRRSQFNRATMALRQPGSTFKLMAYLAALEQGLTPSDTIACDPFSWRGQTFASGCRGRLSLRSAFAVSSNTAALRLGQKVGLDAVVDTAEDLGISTPLSPVPGLVLGQSEVRLLELTAAYGAVANDGVWRPPTTIRRLRDAESCTGEDLEACRSGAERVGGAGGDGRTAVSPEVARQMQDLLRAVVRSGTGRGAFLGGAEGGKTGTTNEGRDLLFIGYEPARHWVIGIWLGNDDNSPSRSSSSLAASLWSRIVRGAGTGSGEGS
jgi:peptidoglycan glycosyltransferase